MSRIEAMHSPGGQSEGRRRIAKACDRCRVKKVKCDGNVPCPRCKEEDAVCMYSAQRKAVDRPISAGYVEQLEVQHKVLIKTLKETWQKYGPMSSEECRSITIHEIATILGVYDDASGQMRLDKDFIFDEDLQGNNHARSTNSEETSPSTEKPLSPDPGTTSDSTDSPSSLISVESNPVSPSPPINRRYNDEPPRKMKRTQAPVHCQMPPKPFELPGADHIPFPPLDSHLPMDATLNDIPFLTDGEDLSNIAIDGTDFGLADQMFGGSDENWAQWVSSPAFPDYSEGD